MSTHVTLAQAQAQLSELVTRVSTQHERITVTVEGRPAVVLMAAEELESIEETLEILSDPGTMRRLQASEAEIAAGMVESAADVAAAMASPRRTSAE